MNANFEYNFGRFTAASLVIIFISLIAFAFGWTVFVGIGAAIAIYFIIKYSILSPKAKRALLIGYGFGLFQSGVVILTPILPGGI